MATIPPLLSINYFAGDGVTVTREINFAGGYISEDHIYAVNIDDDDNETPVSFTLQGESTILLDQPTPAGIILKVQRRTPKVEPLVDYTDGSGITEDNLDKNAKQAIFLAAEAADIANDGVGTLSERAILVPRGEVAPYMPPRNELLNSLLAIGSDGNIIGVNYSGGNPLLDTSIIEHEGTSLLTVVNDIIADYVLTAGQIQALSQDVTDQATDISTVTTQLDGVVADFADLEGIVNDITNIMEPGSLAYLLAEESSARIDGDDALAATIGIIGTTSVDGASFILDLDKVKTGPSETLAERFTAIDAVGTNALAQITSEQTARIAGDAAEASARVALGAQLDSSFQAGILAEQNARVTGDAAEATARNALATTLRDEASALVLSEETARIAADAAEASARNVVAAEIRSEVAAEFVTEAAARVAGDSAIATKVDLLGVLNPGGTAFVLDYGNVEIGGGETLSQRVGAVQTTANLADSKATAAQNTANAANAAVAAEETARINAIAAEASARNTVEANLTTEITNQVAAEEIARINADTAEGQARIAAIQAEAAARGQLATTLRSETDAKVAAESSARATAIAAEASARTSAVATLNSNITAAVSTETTARVTAVNGALARWALKLDANDHIVGMEFNNSAQTSNLIINVDHFEIFTPAGLRKIFGASAEGVTLGADLFMGTGRIVSKAGGFMKVQGTGFGVANEFIEWFGPVKAISACDRASATYYLTVGGDAYFGGSLSAGILTARAQSTVDSATANIQVGPFETLGNSKQVVGTWSFFKVYTIDNAANWSGSLSATLIIERSIGGASWTEIGRATITGTIDGIDGFGPEEPGQINLSASGSVTATDTTGATTNLYMRARIINRTLPTITSNVTSAGGTSQRVGIISTEE